MAFYHCKFILVPMRSAPETVAFSKSEAEYGIKDHVQYQENADNRQAQVKKGIKGSP